MAGMLVSASAAYFASFANQHGPAAFSSGFSNILISVFLVSLGYLCLCLCVAEMASIFPFGGGSFGYTRCILHPFVGYLVGIAEVAAYILYVSAAVQSLGAFMTLACGTPFALEPMWWAIFFLIAVAVQMQGGSVFWTSNLLLAFIPVVVILLYFLTALPSMDMARWTSFPPPAGPSAEDFIKGFPVLSWLFVGIEGMVLASDDAPHAAKVVPKAILTCWGTLFVTAMLIVFACATNYPGTSALEDEAVLMNPVFQRAFDMSAQHATLLVLPGALGTAFGFHFAVIRRMASMASSRVLPSFLAATDGPRGTPHASILTASALSMGVLLLLRYADPEGSSVVFNLCMMCSCFVYMSTAATYWICADRYSNLPRQFVSPLGLVGAALCGGIFAFMMTSLAFFQADYTTLVTFAIILTLGTGYYLLVAKKREFFSEEEVNKFMKAYIINGKRPLLHCTLPPFV